MTNTAVADRFSQTVTLRMVATVQVAAPWRIELAGCFAKVEYVVG